MKTLADLAHFKTGIDFREIDPNIVELVKAMNEFSGLATWQSCGGHQDRQDALQAPAGEWYVMFSVFLGEEGWEALSRVAFLAEEYSGQLTCTVRHFTATGPNRNLVHFQLYGIEFEPDRVATMLRASA
jgi:hypothetical protein